MHILNSHDLIYLIYFKTLVEILFYLFFKLDLRFGVHKGTLQLYYFDG